MHDSPSFVINRSAKPTNFKKIVRDYLDERGSKTKFNQVRNFVNEMIGFDNPSLCKHVLLVFEEIETARQIELRYLRNQLQKGQICGCIIPSRNIAADEKMWRTEMADNRIDVDSFEATGQLKIIMLSSKSIHNQNTKTASEIIQEVSQNLKTSMGQPTAGFGAIALDDDPMRSNRIPLQLELEQMASQMIAQSDITWICPYHVEDISLSLEKEWMQKLVLSHDAVIYVPRNSNGIALRLS